MSSVLWNFLFLVPVGDKSSETRHFAAGETLGRKESGFSSAWAWNKEVSLPTYSPQEMGTFYVQAVLCADVCMAGILAFVPVVSIEKQKC